MAALFFLGLLPGTHAAALDIGTGVRDITPDWPVPMWGGRDWPPTTDSYQRLKVKALAIAQGEKRVVVVTADALYFGVEISDRIRARVARLGLKGDEILLNASHSHSTPALCPLDMLDPKKVDERYRDFFVDRTVEAVGDALGDLQPGRLFLQESTCDVAINKRLDGRMAPNPAGPVDRRVRLLAARALDGTLRGVLFLYGCHTSDMNDNSFGGDFFGFAQDELEARWPGALFLSAQGMAGDTRPDHRDASGKNFVWGDLSLLPQTREFGRRLAAAVDTALAAPATEVAGEIRSSLQVISVPLEPARPRRIAREMAKGKDPFQARWGRFMLARYALADPAFPTSLPYTLQALRIGSDFAIVGLDGEVFTGIGRAIEAALAPQTTYVLGYSNSVAGYIPTTAEIPRGGYEIEVYYWWNVPGPFAAGIEPTVVNGAVGLVREMKRR